MHLVNTKRAKLIMEQSGVDCVIGTSLQNIQYLTGFTSFLKQVSPATTLFGLYSDSESPKVALVAPYSEADVIVASKTNVEDVKLYGSFPLELSYRNLEAEEKNLYELCSHQASPDAPTALVELLHDFGLDSSSIALDESGLPYGMFEKVCKMLPKAKVVPGSKLLSQVRMIKTQNEIEKLSNVVSLTEKAMKSAAELIRKGQSTFAIAKELERIETENSGKPVFTVVASGSYRAFPNALPSNKRLSEWDLVRFDVGCSLQGYCSDLGRTIAVDKVKKEILEYYKATLMGLDVAIDHVVPGARASDIYNIAVETVRKNGISKYRRHHTGHGIGMEVYDPPSISPNDNTILEEGMVLNLETPYYELGFAGLIVEDCMVVRKKHPELLSKLPRVLDGF
jgi:Xaa-Pro dipeptidase